MSLSELFDNMFDQYNEFILQADDFLEKIKKKEKKTMITVFIRKPNGCYLELARFHFLDDAEKFIRTKRADNDFPADTVFLMEIGNNGK